MVDRASVWSVERKLSRPQKSLHIVYVDESGTHSEARYFVVAGLAVFERETYYLAQALDQLQVRFFPGVNEPIAFHAAPLRAPKEHLEPPWDTLTNGQRRELLTAVYGVLAESRAKVFAVAMEKAGLEGDPYRRGFEEIVNRFDRMLWRTARDRGEQQRGLVVMAESSFRENLEVFARKIWTQGHRWGEIHNMADIPYFAPARSTRLLQLADFTANAVFGRYENGYTRDFDRIASRFDQDEGRIHGLVHFARDRYACYCPACVQRRAMPRPEPEEPAQPR